MDLVDRMPAVSGGMLTSIDRDFDTRGAASPNILQASQGGEGGAGTPPTQQASQGG